MACSVVFSIIIGLSFFTFVLKFGMNFFPAIWLCIAEMRYYRNSMDKGKPERYIIFGAGAIGTSVGGLLVNIGKRVEFIGRPAYADAIQRGVTIKYDEKEIFFKASAVTAANQLAYKEG